WPSADAACDAVVRVAQRIVPQSADSARLQQMYGLYRKLYPSLQTIFHGLHAEGLHAAITNVKMDDGGDRAPPAAGRGHRPAARWRNRTANRHARAARRFNASRKSGSAVRMRSHPPIKTTAATIPI